MRSPPADVSASSLFRKLCERRPIARLAYRFPFDTESPIYCRALTALEWAGAEEHDNPQLAVLSASLCDAEGRPDLLLSTLVQLGSPVLDALEDAVSKAHESIAPRYAWIELNDWEKALVRGAKENPSISMRLGASYEVYAPRVIDRPDRFWGLPTHELCDGHWLAYYASRKVYEDLLKQHE